MTTPDYVLQLDRMFPIVQYPPSANSMRATEQSIRLFHRVDGSDRYRSCLRAFTNEVMDGLIATSSPVTGTLLRKRQVHVEHLELILHTAAHVASEFPRLKVIACPRANATFSKPPYGHLARDRMNRLTSLLTGKDGIVFNGEHVPGALFYPDPGFYDRTTGTGVVTRLEPNPVLLDRMARAGLVFHGHPYEDRQRFNPNAPVVTIDDIPIHRHLLPEAEVIPWLNERLARSHVFVALPDYATFKASYDFENHRSRLNLTGTQLSRRFSGDDRSGGRLYGHAVQQVPKDRRRDLLLDGKPVCEWDYRSMQPNLAYSIAGTRCPDGDAYAVPGYLGEHDRNLMKLCMAIGLGCKKGSNPVPVFANAAKEEFGQALPPGIAAQMDQHLWEHNAPIRHFRASGAWKQLQYLESEICLKVLNYLRDRDVVCIPIHDSFIVQKRHEELLKEAMRTAVEGLSSPPRIKPN